MRLTKANYHSLENRYLTNSRVNDFLKDKNFFYRKHISGEIKQVKTDALIIGSAVDTWLTQGRAAFEKNYVAVSRRNLSAPPEDYTELTIAQYQDIIDICTAVTRQQAYKDLKDFKRQTILSMSMELGSNFCGLAGIPDFYNVIGEKALIVDLKTAEQAKNSAKYDYHCVEYGYYRQLAFYDILLRHRHPEVKEVVHAHLVVEKDVDKIFNVYTFVLSARRIEREKRYLLEMVIPEIAKEVDFLPRNTTWNDAAEIGDDMPIPLSKEDFSKL